MSEAQQTSAQSIYGANAITGNEGDAKDPNATEVTVTTDGQKETVHVSDPSADNEQQQKPPAQNTSVQGEETQNAQTTTTEQQRIKDVDEAIERHDKSIDEISASLKEKGIDFDAVRNEFDENLELSEDTYKQLEKAGYPPEAVDLILDGMQAAAEKFVDAAYAHVGGQQQFEAIQSFVQAQGGDAIDIFNSIMGCKDIRIVNNYVDGIRAQMALSHGTQGTTFITGGTGAQGQVVSAFQSDAEMVAAMSDPRYEKDAAYRRQVQQKVIASNKLFV